MVRLFITILVLCMPALPARADGEQAVDDRCQTMFDWIISEPVRFVQSAAELRLSSHQVLLRLADFTFDCPGYRIDIRGHTDSVGDETYNQALSEQRAAAIAAFLVKHGVDADRLATSGAGSSEAVADNGTAWGREQNRRIEFRLVTPGNLPDS